MNPLPAAEFRRYVEHDAPPSGPRRVIRAVTLSDTSPPLYYLVLNFWTRILGTSDAVLRLFSVLCAMACLPVLWALAVGLEGRRAAWAACVLFTFSPLALHYSAEGRMYSLAWLLGLSLAWSTLALSSRGPRAHLVALWIFSAASALLTHYFLVFVLAACLAWMLAYPNRLPRVYCAALIVVTAVSVSPWYVQLPESLSHWRVTGGWLDSPLTLENVILNPVRLIGSYVSASGAWGAARRTDLVVFAAYGTLIIAAVRLGVGRLFTKPK